MKWFSKAYKPSRHRPEPVATVRGLSHPSHDRKVVVGRLFDRVSIEYVIDGELAFEFGMSTKAARDLATRLVNAADGIDQREPDESVVLAHPAISEPSS